MTLRAPAIRMNEAMDLAREGDIDFAVLDINVGGSQSFPVADILRKRDIPFVFNTGYEAEGFLDGYRHQPTLRNPYEPYELERAIARLSRISIDGRPALHSKDQYG